VLANLIRFSHHFNFITSVEEQMVIVKVCVCKVGLYVIAK
jgi:hypothetical protein